MNPPMSHSSTIRVRTPTAAVSLEEALHPQASRKRSIDSSPGSGSNGTPSDNYRRKSQKVTRACDHCKRRKAKCSGTIPCAKCSDRGLTCMYDAQYSRGRPPTPPLSDAQHVSVLDRVFNGASSGSRTEPSVQLSRSNSVIRVSHRTTGEGSGLASRASPEVGLTEVQGQVSDPTSGVTFLHRAWKRLAKHRDHMAPRDNVNHASVDEQQLMLAGDRPLPQETDSDLYKLSLPSHEELIKLSALYFDVCIATYRILHRPSVESWLQTVEDNVRQGRVVWQGVGRAKASIVLVCLSIAIAHESRSREDSHQDEEPSLSRSDRLFCVSVQLAETQTGLPQLESAQTRIIQTLYLLTSSRMNRAWYTFGNALQLISALGMHRKAAKERHLANCPADYLQAQLRMRTFWTAYILDKYLGVIFGRPRHYHDDDIDQDLPDRLEDEDMTSHGPTVPPETGQMGCHIDALIFHTRIARIIGKVSREVYSIKDISESDRISAAHRISREIHEWKKSLPPYLGSISPSMLVTSFRRQSIVLQLGYSHAIMHTNRPFLLATLRPESETQISECLDAARAVLESVDGLAVERPLFHAFWWTQYVTFCALVVSYIWDIQLKRRGTILAATDQAKHSRLMELARRCQIHLAEATAANSPSRKYAVILEEFCSEAMGQNGAATELAEAKNGQQQHQQQNQQQSQQSHGDVSHGDSVTDTSLETYDDDCTGNMLQTGGESSQSFGYSLLDQWNTNDWLDLDSSAFGPFMADMDAISGNWLPNMAL
ncbi:Fungal trans [Geosmithia morbida]|uniref:Fungal trans n=1 Tax=Geosmithia morbida TaxID=1094350 RepID=A0A9P4Z116_9HYPO|nr:Fungal trans [Geosmithia morbida]KAF4126162.1 Fungal trans [Geosmithia morbida]